MERIEIIMKDTEKALKTLEKALKQDYNDFIRDAAIQRFEYSFELLWKSIKLWLKDREGILCNSPKGCFRELLKIEIINGGETETLLEMTDTRNLTVHTYQENIAIEMYNKLPQYLKLMKKLLKKMKKN